MSKTEEEKAIRKMAEEMEKEYNAGHELAIKMIAEGRISYSTADEIINAEDSEIAVSTLLEREVSSKECQGFIDGLDYAVREAEKKLKEQKGQ